MEAYQETSLLKSPALRQLSKFLGEHRQEWAHAMPDLETFERGLHAHLMAVERELLAEALAQYDVVAEHITVTGVVYSQSMEETETYLTSAGEVVVKRHIYRPDRQDWEAHRHRLEEVPTAAATLAVSLDGVLAPMRNTAPDRAQPKAAEKQPTGPKGYQEVGCGTVRLYDAEGERLPTVRYGRRPESKKATLCAELEAEGQAILAVPPHLKVVKLADGARDNWRFLDTLNLGVPASQMKQSGMRWAKPGGQAILTLRNLIQSERWESGWARLRKNYQQPVLVGAADAYFSLPLAA